MPIDPGLYLVSTPIGNPLDITLRALRTLEAAHVVYCEDTRLTSQLFAEHNISTQLMNYHEHNAQAVRPEIVKRVRGGEVVALVTDAGTPSISDPGFKLVQSFREEGLPVTAVPGPSAVVNAMTLSGLPTDRFFFEGFLPAKSGARLKRLKELLGVPGTLVFYEAPHRIQEMVDDCAEVFAGRPYVLAREMTKKYEEVIGGVLTGKGLVPADLKGEMVVLIGPGEQRELGDGEILELLKRHLEDKSAKDAVRAVVDETGLAKKRVYELSLQLK